MSGAGKHRSEVGGLGVTLRSQVIAGGTVVLAPALIGVRRAFRSRFGDPREAERPVSHLT